MSPAPGGRLTPREGRAPKEIGKSPHEERAQITPRRRESLDRRSGFSPNAHSDRPHHTRRVDIMYKYMNRTTTCTDRRSSRRRDRRGSPRYAALEHAVELGWREGDEYRRAPGWLRDISHTGAAAHFQVPPPEGTTLWIRLSGDAPSDWIEVAMVGVERNRAFLGFGKSTYVARWKFATVCPYDVFSTAINGVTHMGETRDSLDNSADRTNWS